MYAWSCRTQHFSSGDLNTDDCTYRSSLWSVTHEYYDCYWWFFGQTTVFSARVRRHPILTGVWHWWVCGISSNVSLPHHACGSRYPSTDGQCRNPNSIHNHGICLRYRYERFMSISNHLFNRKQVSAACFKTRKVAYSLAFWDTWNVLTNYARDANFISMSKHLPARHWRPPAWNGTQHGVPFLTLPLGEELWRERSCVTSVLKHFGLNVTEKNFVDIRCRSCHYGLDTGFLFDKASDKEQWRLVTLTDQLTMCGTCCPDWGSSCRQTWKYLRDISMPPISFNTSDAIKKRCILLIWLHSKDTVHISRY